MLIINYLVKKEILQNTCTILLLIVYYRVIKIKIMKITINLSDAEVKGIKEYIKETEGVDNVLKQAIQTEIQNIVSGNLQVGAVWDYISKHLK